MTPDAFLTACAAALPEPVLERIFKKVIQQNVLEHPYITERARIARQRFSTLSYSDRWNKFLFIGGEVNSSHWSKNNCIIEVIRVHTPYVCIYINMNKATSVVWEEALKEKSLEEKRRELAFAIVLLHRIYPNTLTRDTMVVLFPYDKTKMRPVSLHDLYCLPEGVLNAKMKPSRLTCVVM